MLTIGSQQINDLYVGSQQIREAYVGQTLIYPAIDYTEPFYVQNDNNYDINVLWSTTDGQDSSPFGSNPSVFYSTNRNTPLVQWTEVVFDYDYDTGLLGATVTVPANSKMYMYLYLSDEDEGLGSLTANGAGSTTLTCPDQEDYSIGGNAMSLIYGQNFTGSETAFPTGTGYNLSMVFTDQNLVDAGNLLLPATTLSLGCYQYMFSECHSLVNAPSVLPATALAVDCYANMFSYCTSLVVSPAISATSTAQSCCYRMFYNCTALKESPELLSTDLRDNSYEQMFDGCSLLNKITCNAVNFGTNSINLWTRNISSTGSFYKNSSSSWSTGASGIPDNWTVYDI